MNTKIRAARWIIAGGAMWFCFSLLSYAIQPTATLLDHALMDIPPSALWHRVACLGLIAALATLYHRTSTRDVHQSPSGNGKRLARKDEQLRAATEQIAASDEQLRAANEQLRAANEQLLAGERELEQQRDRIQRYLDIAGVIILVLDNQGTVTLINRKGCEVLGLSEAEILKTPWIDTFIPAPARAGARETLQHVLAGHVDIEVSHENAIVSASGTERIIVWQNACLRDETGAIVSVLSSGTDVTEQRRAESHEAQLQDRLNRARRMESLGLLAGGVAHDLNNMLTPALAYPDLILEELPQDPELTAIREDIVAVRDASKTAAVVIRDLLTLSRRGHYNLHPLLLNDVVTELTHSAGYLDFVGRNPELKVNMNLNDDLLPIAGSEAHLMQAILNLIFNAAEAMPNGGTLDIETANLYVDRDQMDYEVLEEGEYAILRVKDQGGGISEDDLAHIFEPFYTRKHMGHSSGSGLGLAVVYGVVKDHGGRIDVKTKKGKGTTFTLAIPLTRESVSDQDVIEDVLRGDEHVLVVDDSATQRTVATRLLTSLGYKVQTAEGGQEAVQLLREARDTSPFDIILLDMIMEDGFDGMDTYETLMEIYPGQKCAFVSGFSETERVRQARAQGGCPFLAKPYTLSKLAHFLRTALDAS